jgi:hypothetical protein
MGSGGIAPFTFNLGNDKLHVQADLPPRKASVVPTECGSLVTPDLVRKFRITKKQFSLKVTEESFWIVQSVGQFLYRLRRYRAPAWAKTANHNQQVARKPDQALHTELFGTAIACLTSAVNRPTPSKRGSIGVNTGGFSVLFCRFFEPGGGGVKIKRFLQNRRWFITRHHITQ